MDGYRRRIFYAPNEEDSGPGRPHPRPPIRRNAGFDSAPPTDMVNLFDTIASITSNQPMERESGRAWLNGYRITVTYTVTMI
jgi:hypothetical protein